MARLYIAGHLVTHWTVVLAIVYGILALITLRYRNRRWVRPLLPILFIILPTLLWPIVMVGTGVFIVAVLFFNRDDGIWKKMRRGNNEKDAEKGLGTDMGNLREQPSSEHTPSVSTQSENSTTISEPPPTYQPYDRTRIMPEEELAR